MTQSSVEPKRQAALLAAQHASSCLAKANALGSKMRSLKSSGVVGGGGGGGGSKAAGGGGGGGGRQSTGGGGASAALSASDASALRTFHRATDLQLNDAAAVESELARVTAWIDEQVCSTVCP